LGSIQYIISFDFIGSSKRSKENWPGYYWKVYIVNLVPKIQIQAEQIVSMLIIPYRASVKAYESMLKNIGTAVH
jgi:hypothetical protein